MLQRDELVAGPQRFRIVCVHGILQQSVQIRSVNLDYLDPAGVDPDTWAADPDTLVVPRAGEDLFRLR